MFNAELATAKLYSQQMRSHAFITSGPEVTCGLTRWQTRACLFTRKIYGVLKERECCLSETKISVDRLEDHQMHTDEKKNFGSGFYEPGLHGNYNQIPTVLKNHFVWLFYRVTPLQVLCGRVCVAFLVVASYCLNSAIKERGSDLGEKVQ